MIGCRAMVGCFQNDNVENQTKRVSRLSGEVNRPTCGNGVVSDPSTERVDELASSAAQEFVFSVNTDQHLGC
jgi:hypothetical protein